LRNEIDNQEVYIRKIFDEFLPNFVFVRLGNYLSNEIVKYMRKSSITILYLGDSLQLYPEMKEKVFDYDAVFSYENSDVDILRSKGINVYPLMGVYDKTQYYPLKIIKDIDISFIGAMYDERIKILKRISKDFSEFKLLFIGNYSKKKYLIDYIFHFNKKMRLSYMNTTVNFREANEIYNRSKICLNLNRKEANTGWNSRLCEILGTQSLQVVNYNKIVLDEFGDGIVTFTDYDDLKDKIQYFLTNDLDRNEIARKGYNAVSKHTNDAKLREVIDIVLELKNIHEK